MNKIPSFSEWIFSIVDSKDTEDMTVRMANMFRFCLHWPVDIETQEDLLDFIKEAFPEDDGDKAFAARTAWSDYQKYLESV